MAAGVHRAAHRAPAFVLDAEELCAGFASVQTCSGSGQRGGRRGVADNPPGTWSPCSAQVGAAWARGEGAAAVASGEAALRWTLSKPGHNVFKRVTQNTGLTSGRAGRGATRAGAGHGVFGQPPRCHPAKQHFALTPSFAYLSLPTRPASPGTWVLGLCAPSREACTLLIPAGLRDPRESVHTLPRGQGHDLLPDITTQGHPQLHGSTIRESLTVRAVFGRGGNT